MSPHHLPALILALIGAALLLRWLIGDRSRGRRRCPKCWYDMAGIDTLACPECGRTARSERALYRSRRRPRRLLVGIAAAALTVYAATTAQTRRGEGWTRYVPTTAWLLLERKVTRGSPLDQRLREQAMWRWQAQVALRKNIELTPDDWRSLITYHSPWPAGVPLTLSPASQRIAVRRTLRMSVADGFEVVMCNPATGQPAYPYFQDTSQPPRIWHNHTVTKGWHSPTPPITLNENDASFEVDLGLSTGWKGSRIIVYKHRLTYPIVVKPSIHEVIHPVDRPALTEQLSSSIRLEVFHWPSPTSSPNGQTSFITPRLQLDRHDGLTNIALGLHLEFIRDQHVMGTARTLFAIPWHGSFPYHAGGLIHIEGDWHAVLDAMLDPEGWTVRVTSDPEMVFTDAELFRPNYWRGEFTVPLADLVDPIQP